MNYLQQLGPLAIASRLKSLTEKLVREMQDIYRGLDIGFEPRWFTFVHLLHSRGPMTITHIAKELDQTHPAANQVANALEKKGLVASRRDRKDNRKRIIDLTPEGRELAGKLQPVWASVERAVAELLSETDPEFFDHILRIERGLSERTMKERILGNLEEVSANAIDIIPYRPEYAPLFRSLNEEWLNTHFRIEPEDERVLGDPGGMVIARGGFIAFVRSGREIVGTGALLHHDKDSCELTKMAVVPPYRGKKLGRRLLEHLIGVARERNYRTMTLLTSPDLEAAVALYRSAGFREVPAGPGAGHSFERCSIRMELTLKNNETTR